MRPLDHLINLQDPGWPIVQQWIRAAKNHVEVLAPVDDATRGQALVETQVTTRSPMGAVIYETGGILVDHGWLRILGSGCPRLPRSLPGWNQGRSSGAPGTPPPFLLVADDVLGGFFAIDGGGLGIELGKVCYLAPELLKWESLKRGYGDFLAFCFQGDLAKFYETFRWPRWEAEVAALRGDEALTVYPPLSTNSSPIGERHRGRVPVAELYRFHVDENAPL